MKSYKIISSFNNGKRIVRMDEALEFTNVLEERLAVHGNVIDKLSDGFRYLFFIYLVRADHPFTSVTINHSKWDRALQ